MPKYLFTGERVVPRMHDYPSVLQRHIERYNFALPLVNRKRVLDCGCGSGYGMWIMSFLAQSITGIDKVFYDLDFFCPVKFIKGDLEKMDLPQSDIITCFEVLEHLNDPDGFLSKINTTLVWSIPVNHPGKFHKHVFSSDEIIALFEKHFKHNTFYAHNLLSIKQARGSELYDCYDIIGISNERKSPPSSDADNSHCSKCHHF